MEQQIQCLNHPKHGFLPEEQAAGEAGNSCALQEGRWRMPIIVPGGFAEHRLREAPGDGCEYEKGNAAVPEGKERSRRARGDAKGWAQARPSWRRHLALPLPRRAPSPPPSMQITRHSRAPIGPSRPIAKYANKDLARPAAIG